MVKLARAFVTLVVARLPLYAAFLIWKGSAVAVEVE
jgi:hypothetical protein